MTRSKGFTLMEIMVALFIFVIVMGMIVTGFNVIMRSRDQLQVQSRQLAKIQLAMMVMGRDITQIIERPIRTRDEVFPAVLTSNREGDLLEFTRLGLINPFANLPRSSLLRVAYHLEDGKLYRRVWQVIDRAPNSKSASRLLLSNIRLLQFSFVTREGRFEATIGNNMPRAVKVSIEFNNQDHIERIFPVLGGRGAGE